MRCPEEELVKILKESGIDFVFSLPCEKIRYLLSLLYREFFHVPLTREEEGVGISAGVALCGKRPAMFIQSSGIGNMLNALLSLTFFYSLPLPLFISQRGIYKETIPAQIPMGERLPGILKEAGIEYSIISTAQDFHLIKKGIKDVFDHNKIHAFLLNPRIWEESDYVSHHEYSEPVDTWSYKHPSPRTHEFRLKEHLYKIPLPIYTRYEILKILSPFLDGKAVICNLGFPSKELYSIKDQDSNFYMLGSMGMATPIGIGVAISVRSEVIVIDGDGSILMNPNSLATASLVNPENLMIIAIDNGAYGSTGNQRTLSSMGIDLEDIAKAFGIDNTIKVYNRDNIEYAMKTNKGLRFIHILALPGNRDVPNIPLHHLEIKRRFQEFILRTGED